MKALIIASGGIINTLIIIVAGLALLWFFWGLVKFIFHSGDAKTHEEGRNIMIWGIITLFVMFSLWGLLGFISGALNIPFKTSGSSSEVGNPCVDSFGNPTYVGDCGTF